MKKKIALKAEKSLIILDTPRDAHEFEITVDKKDGRVMLTYLTPKSREKVIAEVTSKREVGRYDLLGTFNDMSDELCQLVMEEEDAPKVLLRSLLEANKIVHKEWLKVPPYKTQEEVFNKISSESLCRHFVDMVNAYNEAFEEMVIVLKTTSGDQSKLGRYLRGEKK